MTFEYFVGFGKCSAEFANQILIFNNEVFFEDNTTDDNGFYVSLTKS